MKQSDIHNLNRSIDSLTEQLNWKNTRPLIRLDKSVMFTLYIVSDLAFKIFLIWKLCSA